MVTYPTDWKESSIGDLFNVFAGGDVKKQYFSKFRTSAYPYEIFSNGIENRGHYGYTSLAVFPENSVTVTARGTIGQAFYREAPYDAIIRLLVLSPKSENIKPKFYEYYINNQIVFERENTGVPQLTAPKIKEKTVPFFDGKEQEKIIETLQVFDTYIDDLAELIEKKKGIRDGALEDLISGKARIVGFSGERKEYSINDITCEVITGGTPSTSRREYYGGNIPWLASTEIHQKRITKPTTYITELGLQNSSAKIAPEKSVLIALAGQGKTRGTAAYLTKPMALNQSLAALVTNEKCNSEFLYYLVESMYSSLRELSSGDGGRGGLNKKLIKGVLVKIPIDVDEQEAIANILFAMDEEIRDLETEREKIIQIREGAMDDLLTGRVRLTK